MRNHWVFSAALKLNQTHEAHVCLPVHPNYFSHPRANHILRFDLANDSVQRISRSSLSCPFQSKPASLPALPFRKKNTNSQLVQMLVVSGLHFCWALVIALGMQYLGSAQHSKKCPVLSIQSVNRLLPPNAITSENACSVEVMAEMLWSVPVTSWVLIKHLCVLWCPVLFRCVHLSFLLCNSHCWSGSGTTMRSTLLRCWSARTKSAQKQSSIDWRSLTTCRRRSAILPAQGQRMSELLFPNVLD